MYPATQDRLKKSSEILTFQVNSNEGNSILEQGISDTQGFPSCYIFKNYWIELSPIRFQYNPNRTNQQKLWEALIHSRNQSKTVIAAGSYSTRLEAALKAEEMITRWQKSC